MFRQVYATSPLEEVFKGLKSFLDKTQYNLEGSILLSQLTENGFLDQIDSSDCLVMHLQCPEDIRSLRSVREIKPYIPIVVLGEYLDINRPIREGANAYVSMEASTRSAVLTALNNVYSKKKVIIDSLGVVNKPTKLPKELSDDEKKVCVLMGEGNRGIDIAKMLGLSQSCVGGIKNRIRRKMGLKNDQVLKWAIEESKCFNNI